MNHLMNENESGERKRIPSQAMKVSAEKAFVMQRKQRLQALVCKRKSDLAYLIRAHEGGTFWLNCILLSKDDIWRYRCTVPKVRTLMYYQLATGASTILALNSGTLRVSAFLQLLEEWEYYYAGAAVQSVKFVLARNSLSMYPLLGSQTDLGYNEDDEMKSPSISKFEGVVFYEHLNIMHVPFELDYYEVLVGLCDVMDALYAKFLCEECFK